MIKKRDALSAKEAASKSLSIAKKALSLKEVLEAENVGSYISFRNEVSTLGLISGLVAAGKKVFVPYMDYGKIEFTRFVSAQELAPSYYGVQEPATKIPADLSTIGVFFVPGLAFDKNGNRIGWGKGFYDKFFSAHRLKGARIGLAFDFQVVEKIPATEHDEKMDAVVTEKKVYRFK